MRIVFDPSRISYADLDARSNRIANFLQSRGVRAGDFVGLRAERSAAFVVQALGELPRQSRNPRYDPAKVEDHYCKFVLRGVRSVLPAEHVRVFAKIENLAGLKNVDEILLVSDGIMVARGDLGIEIPYEELPIIQRKIVKTCLRVGKPVIVATHMLESMIENPMPTRAEITDVANAVFEQADAIMLSGETTVGRYPLKCLEVFNRVAGRIERSGGADFARFAELTSPRQKVVKSAVVMAFRAILVAVPALRRVEPTSTSGPTPRPVR